MLSLITKLYEKKYGCEPPDSPKQVASGAAPGAPSNLLKSAKPAKDDGSSGDDYDDDFDDVPQLGSADINTNSNLAAAATKATPNSIDF